MMNTPEKENPLAINLFSSESKKFLAYPSKEYLASFEEEVGDGKTEVGEEEDDILSARVNWNDESIAASSETQESKAMRVTSLKLAGEDIADQVVQESVSPLAQESLPEEVNYLNQEMHEDGEYLIRPHLEPGERIRFRYNCERVVGLDKRDGIFLIGEKSLYVIENYIIESIKDKKCIKEKGEERDLSVIDRALGVRANSAGVADMHNSKQSDVAADVSGGRAWAYSGGAWGKEKVSCMMF